MQVLQYSPGQKVSIFLETLDGYTRTDGYATPSISRIIFPDLSLAIGYPHNMTKLDVGLYYYQFTLPTGATAIGSYLADIAFRLTSNITYTYLYQVVVTAPYGQYSVSTG